jgi:hypothetical protein
MVNQTKRVVAYQKDARDPGIICEQASVESRIRHIQCFQLTLNIRLRPKNPIGLSIGYPSKLRGNEQLHANAFGGLSDFRLDIDGCAWNGTDNDVHTCQGLLDRSLVGIVNLDDLGVAFNRGLRALTKSKLLIMSRATKT